MNGPYNCSNSSNTIYNCQGSGLIDAIERNDKNIEVVGSDHFGGENKREIRECFGDYIGYKIEPSHKTNMIVN